VWPSAVLYTGTYPKDVSGLVLVGALNEVLQEAQTPEQWAIQRRLIQNDDAEKLPLYPALERIAAQREPTHFCKRRVQG
jgi:hypothetical protein